MMCSKRAVGGATVLALGGRIDLEGSSELQAALAQLVPACRPGEGALVLDFSGVEAVSSAGFRVLYQAVDRVRKQGGRLAVAALTPIVRETFEITQFSRLVPCYPDVEGALAHAAAEG